MRTTPFHSHSLMITLISLVGLFLSGDVKADAQFLRGLGVSQNQEIRLPIALSAHGDVIAGNQIGLISSPFLWNLSEPAPQLLPVPSTCSDAWVTGVSGDGVWAIGYCLSSESPRSFRSSARHFQFLDGNELFSVPHAISYDGSVVVGSWQRDTSKAPAVAFYWKLSTGMQTIPLPESASSFSEATGISGNGQVITGYSEQRGAFTWNSNGEFTALKVEAGMPTDVSANGLHIVGAVQESSFLQRAFLFSEKQLTILDPAPELGRSTVPSGISATGDIVAGTMQSSWFGPLSPFLWTADHGFERLSSYYSRLRVSIPPGWDLGELTSLSANGHWIAGIGTNPEGGTEGWVASLLNGCASDLVPDGTLDAHDRERFFQLWEAGTKDADTNADGGVDGHDVEYFFDNFEAGCSTEGIIGRE